MTQQACIVSHLSLELAQQKLFDHLNFQLPLHQFTGLIGRNGQGKQHHNCPIQAKSFGNADTSILLNSSVFKPFILFMVQ